jgi:hypothetical protein
MNNNFTIGRVNFGPRDSFVTLGQLIDEIAAQEELVEDLCIFAGNLLTETIGQRAAIRALLEEYECENEVMPAYYQALDALGETK